jgi:hypothetical protein
MKRSTLVVLVFALMFVVVFTGQIFAEDKDKDKDKDKNVVVTNTPLPVMGTVTVGNTPLNVNVENSPMVGIVGPVDVNVTNPVSISGTPYVNVANTPQVEVTGTPNVNANITNQPLEVRVVSGNVSVYGREPVTHKDSIGNLDSGTQFFYDVPSNKILVIEQISMFVGGFVISPSYLMVKIVTSINGNSGFTYLPLQKTDDTTSPFFTICENVRIYADSSDRLQISVLTTTSPAFHDVSFYGYLISKDSPSLAP